MSATFILVDDVRWLRKELLLPPYSCFLPGMNCDACLIAEDISNEGVRASSIVQR